MPGVLFAIAEERGINQDDLSVALLVAGAIGMVALYALNSHSPAVRLVGSDIAHAVPLTLIAGLGHASLGSVDFNLLIVLLIGSIPGIWLGSHLSTKASDRMLRILLCIILSVSGYKLLA